MDAAGLHDGIALSGVLSIIEHDVGRLLVGAERDRAALSGAAREIVRKNLIVDQGLSVISRFLGGALGAPMVGATAIGSMADLVVSAMQLGNSVGPPSPGGTDVAGVGALVVSRAVTVTYPAANKVRFSVLLQQSEFVGTTFTEEALVCANGLVFAKATPFSKVKGSTGVQFDHTITLGRM